MVWLTNFDAGVVFCRRRDFEATGGYNESLRVAEDVGFLLALRRVGRTHGKRLTRLRHVKAVASTRKFDEYGDWHFLDDPGLSPAEVARALGLTANRLNEVVKGDATPTTRGRDESRL